MIPFLLFQLSSGAAAVIDRPDGPTYTATYQATATYEATAQASKTYDATHQATQTYESEWD